MTSEDYSFVVFIEQHKSQLLSSDVPEYLWHCLYMKLKEEIYDLGDKCELKLNSDETGVECFVKTDLKASGLESIYIIDHAWTFELSNMENSLKSNDNLRERVALLVGIDTTGADNDDVVDAILENIWSHISYYDITFGETRKKLWYILDEIGNFLTHDSKNPNIKQAPFLFLKNKISYTIVWLINDVMEGGTLKVNRSAHIVDEYLNKCLSYVWTRTLPSDELVSPVGKTLSKEFFKSHRSNETNPDLTVKNLGKISLEKLPLKVYSNVEFVQKHLTDYRFYLVDDKDDCDIAWLFEHFYNFEDFSKQYPQVMVNQFPNETILTTKDLLAALGSENTWYPKTFNLKTELAQFINYYKKCENEFNSKEVEEEKHNCFCNCHNLLVECGVCVEDKTCKSIKRDTPNVWIVKPWNLARGMGIFITQNLDHILRKVEAFPNEPKIASRYITDPVLFYREDLGANVKFDIRYMLLLTNVDPVKAYVSKIFWLRFANKEFVLYNWSDYETHFTVMNYQDGRTELKNIMYQEFIELFERQYPSFTWKYIEGKIHSTLQDLLTDATSRDDPFRLVPSPQSRAMYAVDMMLEWSQKSEIDIEGQVCEVNFCPDCTRACQFFPNFFNEVFSTLFLDDPINMDELF